MPAAPVSHLGPRRGMDLGLLELIEHRELVYFFVWRDLKVRYRQAALGAAWAIIQPVFAMVVFSVVFGRLVGLPSDGVPYPLFAYCGLLPWQLFATGLTQASLSLVNHQGMIRKIYFPRLALPLSSVLGAAVDFAVAFSVLIVLMMWYGLRPGAAALTLPLFVALAQLTALGAGVWLSALCAHYRDVRHTVPFLVQGWLFITPVLYPSSLIPPEWRALYGLNPMAGVVEGFRWALLGKAPPDLALLGVSVGASALLLVTGFLFFRRVERSLADVV